MFTVSRPLDNSCEHTWYPCSQMKDYEAFPPVPIRSAKGVWLQTADGHKILDAISSWWCKSLGHAHPRLQAALAKQAEKFEHVIMVNTTHEVLEQVSSRLASLMPSLNKVGYASDGSCAVEMALKMAVHAQALQGRGQRTQFLSLENAYHGETALCMAVSDLGLYKEPYVQLAPRYSFVREVPYVSGESDPLWQDCGAVWPMIEAQLDAQANTLAAIVIEPILQGAAGMKIYSADFLKRLREWCSANDVYLIADEIMTGFGRTGKILACEHAGIEPDFLCLAKGLTAGFLPLSAMITRDDIYALFYDDYETHKAFMHSHTHSGNALALAVALEVFKIFEEEDVLGQVEQRSPVLLDAMQALADATGKLTNVRSIGMMAAADLIPGPDDPKRLGYHVFQNAIKQGAWLRPLGNTLYWLPPLTISDDEIEFLKEATVRAIQS